MLRRMGGWAMFQLTLKHMRKTRSYQCWQNIMIQFWPKVDILFMSLCTAVIGKTSIVKKGKIASICDSTCCYASSLVATAYEKHFSNYHLSTTSGRGERCLLFLMCSTRSKKMVWRMELLSTIGFNTGTLTVLGSHIDRPYGYNLGFSEM